MVNPVTLTSGNDCRPKLLDRPDSVSYAVGLLLGREIKDSIADYDPELFRFCFLAGIQDSAGHRSYSETDVADIVRNLPDDYKKQHPGSPEISGAELQTQVVSAYALGIGSMMSVMAHLLFEAKPGNPELLCDGVLSGAGLIPAGREPAMNFEECSAYLESAGAAQKNRLEDAFLEFLNPSETDTSAMETDAGEDTQPAVSRNAGNGYQAVPLRRGEPENGYVAYRAASYEFRLYGDEFCLYGDTIVLVDPATQEVRTRFCGKVPQVDGQSYEKCRVCGLTLLEPEGGGLHLLIVDRANVSGSCGSLLFTMEGSGRGTALRYVGELKLRPYENDELSDASEIVSVAAKDGDGIRLAFGSGRVVYDPLGMSYPVSAEEVAYLYQGDTLRLEGAILQDDGFRRNLLYARVDGEGGAKNDAYAYGDIDGDGHEDMVYILADDPRRVCVLLLENWELRERVVMREELPYVPFIAGDESCMIRDGILTLWEDTEPTGEGIPCHRYRLSERRLEPVAE